MQKIILISILVLILLTACSKQVIECKFPYFEFKTGECCLDKDNNKICDNDEKQEETKKQTSENEFVKIDRPEKEEIKEVTMEKLYSDALILLDTYEFKYKDDQVSVHKDKIRVLFSRIIKLQKKQNDKYIYLTEVYIDKTNRKASGYCNVNNEKELHSVTEFKYSVCAPLSNLTFDLNYNTYDVKTPLEWLKEFQYIKPSQIFNATQTIKIGKHWKTITPVIFFTYADRPDTVFRIDSHYNIPVRVEIYDNEIMASKYDYDDVQILESIPKKQEIENKVKLNFTYW